MLGIEVIKDQDYWDMQDWNKVKGRGDFRELAAFEAACGTVVPIEEVDSIVKRVIGCLGLETVANGYFDLQYVEYVQRGNILYAKIDYEKIKEEYGLKNERDLVWIKFTKDPFVGAVASGADINFNIPGSVEDYYLKDGKSFVYNTSGVLVHKVGKEWDKSFVLLYPLVGLKNSPDRKKVEYIIGQELLKAGVPIIDRYSHVFYWL